MIGALDVLDDCIDSLRRKAACPVAEIERAIAARKAVAELIEAAGDVAADEFLRGPLMARLRAAIADMQP